MLRYVFTIALYLCICSSPTLQVTNGIDGYPQTRLSSPTYSNDTPNQRGEHTRTTVCYSIDGKFIDLTIGCVRSRALSQLSEWLCDPVGEDEECQYIFSSSWGVRRTVGLVAESDVDRLVKEDDIGVFGSTVQVVFSEGGQGGRRGDVLHD
jgi:hypothetical protein